MRLEACRQLDLRSDDGVALQNTRKPCVAGCTKSQRYSYTLNAVTPMSGASRATFWKLVNMLGISIDPFG